MTWDSAVFCVNNVEDLAALAETEARERVLGVEAENVVVLASAREGVEGLVRKIIVLEGELAVARQAQEVAEEKSYGLFDTAADVERRWEVFEKERREHFEELTLLQTRVSELCLAIVGPPWVRNHLSEGTRIAALHHTEKAGELAALRAEMFSTVELVLGRSLDETFQVEIVGKLVAEFRKLKEQCSCLVRPGMRICDLLLGMPPGRA
jgi:hypothetical protein